MPESIDYYKTSYYVTAEHFFCAFRSQGQLCLMIVHQPGGPHHQAHCETLTEEHNRWFDGLVWCWEYSTNVSHWILQGNPMTPKQKMCQQLRVTQLFSPIHQSLPRTRSVIFKVIHWYGFVSSVLLNWPSLLKCQNYIIDFVLCMYT